MQAFKQHTGIVATLDRAHVDTDAIIPKQFLKSIRRTGFEEGLFYDWRFLDDGSLNPEFELNRPEFRGASILLTRHNFGCGSSREHAVWALLQYGFKVILAPSAESGATRLPAFADIFLNNSVKNGLLCVELPPETIEPYFETVRAQPGLQAAVDLTAQTVGLPANTGASRKFSIAPLNRHILLNGLDEITMTLEDEAAISAYEQREPAWVTLS